MKSKSRKNWILSYVLVCQIEKYGLKLPFAKSEVKAFSMLSPLVLQKIALPVIDSTVFSQFWDITMLILYTFWANSWPFLNLFSRYFRHVDILDQCWPTLNIFFASIQKNCHLPKKYITCDGLDSFLPQFWDVIVLQKKLFEAGELCECLSGHPFNVAVWQVEADQLWNHLESIGLHFLQGIPIQVERPQVRNIWKKKIILRSLLGQSIFFG